MEPARNPSSEDRCAKGAQENIPKSLRPETNHTPKRDQYRHYVRESKLSDMPSALSTCLDPKRSVLLTIFFVGILQYRWMYHKLSVLHQQRETWAQEGLCWTGRDST